ncbi:MAG: futalosine hydrolase [Bacteroidota bacterium]|nr:futalosine hydrolase [Bacteroidota bacterium]
MKILLCSATIYETAATVEYLQQHFLQKSFSEFVKNDLTVVPFVSGVGSPMMAFALGRLLDSASFQLAIHAGINGSYTEKFKLGEVVEVITECWGDLGAEDNDGKLLDVFDLELCSDDQYPFQSKLLEKKFNPIQTPFEKVHGVTVNKVNGTKTSIDLVKKKYNRDVESMEGAAFFYACRMLDLPFISIRSISNYVVPRNRETWEIPLAIKNLNESLIQLIKRLE